MDNQTRKRLLSIAKKAETLALEIRQLCETVQPPIPPLSKPDKQTSSVDVDSTVTQLRGDTRENAMSTLKPLSHRQLGEIYRKLGGSSQEAKKPKEMIIERIIWTLFDFQRGHDILKNQ